MDPEGLQAKFTTVVVGCATCANDAAAAQWRLQRPGSYDYEVPSKEFLELAQGISRGAGAVAHPMFIPGFYAGSAIGGWGSG